MLRCTPYVEEVIPLIAHAGIPGLAGEFVGVGHHIFSFTIKKKCGSPDISVELFEITKVMHGRVIYLEQEASIPRTPGR